MAKFIWLGEKMGLVSKAKDDDDADNVGGDGQPTAPPAGGPLATTAAALPLPVRPVGDSFNPAGRQPMPLYGGGIGMYPRYVGGGGRGVTTATGLKPGQDSPLTKRAAAALAATSNYQQST